MIDRLRAALGRVPSWAWALAFALALCLPRLGSSGFWDPSELKLAEQARDIASSAHPLRSDGRRKLPGPSAARSVAGGAGHQALRRQRARRAPILRALGLGALMACTGPAPGLLRQRAGLLGDAGARHDADLRARGTPAHLRRASHRRAGAGDGRARPLRLAARRPPPPARPGCSASLGLALGVAGRRRACRAWSCRSWRWWRRW